MDVSDGGVALSLFFWLRLLILIIMLNFELIVFNG